jgi:SHS2 domain-containing protein
LAEAVAALAALFVEVPPDASARARSRPLSVRAASDEALLVSLLEEGIYVTEVLGLVPVRARLHEPERGRVAGTFEVFEVDDLEVVGPVPKAISYHDLEVRMEGGGWRCRAVVDV